MIADSPKASAALSRRCLQLILRKELGAQGRDLYNEIQWAIQHGNLPSSVIELLDVPRKVGNEAEDPAPAVLGHLDAYLEAIADADDDFNRAVDEAKRNRVDACQQANTEMLEALANWERAQR